MVPWLKVEGASLTHFLDDYVVFFARTFRDLRMNEVRDMCELIIPFALDALKLDLESLQAVGELSEGGDCRFPFGAGHSSHLFRSFVLLGPEFLHLRQQTAVALVDLDQLVQVEDGSSALEGFANALGFGSKQLYVNHAAGGYSSSPVDSVAA
jgi:hypothetical protein